MATYLIKLRPLGNFFFGGHRNFGTGDSVNYMAVSRRMPLQTSLLGMLRYELLKAKGLLGNLKGDDKKQKRAAALIGPESFSLSRGVAGCGKQCFGAIQRLSPVFLAESATDGIGNVFFPLPAQHGYRYDEAQGVLVRLFENKPEDKSEGEKAEAFKSKDGLSEGFISQAKVQLGLGDVFKEAKQPGITKDRNLLNPDTDERNLQGFYEKTSYRFASLCEPLQELDGLLRPSRPRFAFAFFAEIEAEVGEGLAKTSRIVTLGGEKSRFRMEMAEHEDELETWAKAAYDSGEKTERVVLLGDAAVDSSILDECTFAVTQAAPFGNLVATLKETKNYARLGKDAGGLESSPERYLLKAGSVLYPKDLSELKARLKNENAETVGFNRYVVLPKSQDTKSNDK